MILSTPLPQLVSAVSFFNFQKRWQQRHTRISSDIGKLGDFINFASLSTELQTPEMAAVANATVLPPDNSAEACGSPGEVTNEPSYGHQYYLAGELI